MSHYIQCPECGKLILLEVGYVDPVITAYGGILPPPTIPPDPTDPPPIEPDSGKEGVDVA